MNRSLSVESREIQDVGGAGLLKSALWGLLFDRPILSNDAMCEWILPSGVTRWVAKETEKWSRPTWRKPTTQEIAAAQLLTERYLQQPIAELEQLLQDTPTDDALDEFEEQCNAHLNKAFPSSPPSLEFYLVADSRGPIGCRGVPGRFRHV